jgi:periplasmic divalent cation tolerance protein
MARIFAARQSSPGSSTVVFTVSLSVRLAATTGSSVPIITAQRQDVNAVMFLHVFTPIRFNMQVVIRLYGYTGQQKWNPTMTDSVYVVVLTTLPGDGDADLLALTLVEERLAACVSVLPPMRSCYRWQGVVETADERQVLIKTKAANVAALERRVKELHPYEVPEFLVLNIEAGSPAYLSWLDESVGQAPSA